MSKKIQTLASILIVLGACACGKEAEGGPKLIDDAKQGISKAGDALAAAWDKTLNEVSDKTQEFKEKVEAAKPEMKAKMEGYKATFDEQLALAKQKWAEAKRAAPDKLETLKREANEALDAAKKALEAATSK